MPVYHLYCLRRGVLVDALDVEADGDEHAIRIAHARANCDTVELWNDDRRLHTVEMRGESIFGMSWRSAGRRSHSAVRSETEPAE